MLVEDDYEQSARRNGEIPDLRSVRLAVAELPKRQLLAVVLRYYADLDYQQIADVFQVTSGTVGATLNAAHTTLRGRVGGLMKND
jgi:RNA polymerase sigma factor (sigma-70 family)